MSTSISLSEKALAFSSDLNVVGGGAFGRSSAKMGTKLSLFALADGVHQP
jgi:hypothetical protein